MGYIKDIINKYILIPLSDYIILKPESIDQQKYNYWLNNPNSINEKIYTKDGETLDAFFYNKNKKPSYEDDIIYLYSHGNSGWNGVVLESNTGIYLSSRESVFVYDYRGFGKSSGMPSCDGCFQDSIDIYNFLIHDKKVNPKRIVLFGHSLGACVTSYLMNHILENKIESSNIMILQNAFENIQKICTDILPFIGQYIVSNMKTDIFIRNIDNLDNDINICIIHSTTDELINFSHSVNLANSIKTNNPKLILVTGTHSNIIYNDSVNNHILCIREKINNTPI